MLSFKSLRIAAEWRVRRGRAQRWRVRRKERGGVEKRARMERGEWAVSWRKRHRSSGYAQLSDRRHLPNLGRNRPIELVKI